MDHEMTVLCVGGSGRFAGMVVPELSRRGIRARAMVRNEEQAKLAVANGAAEVVFADLRDARSLDNASTGVEGVFHTGPAFAPDEARMGLNMVEAARRAGVRRFVFSSVIQPTNTDLANHASKIPVENALFASGMEYVLLHPANLFQN
ncbi:MAG: NmrA family NAD(P)-binding protein, partial [Variovorax sp.]